MFCTAESPSQKNQTMKKHLPSKLSLANSKYSVLVIYKMSLYHMTYIHTYIKSIYIAHIIL